MAGVYAEWRGHVIVCGLRGVGPYEELLTVLRRDRPTPQAPQGPGARCDPSKVAGSVD
jgi:hypothetical protein